MRRYFKLYSNCVLVKGAKRSVISDLQLNKSHFISNDVYDILKKTQNNDVDSIYLEYGEDNKETIDEYFQFLESLGMYCSEEELDFYPDFNLKFQTSNSISNCVLENILDINQYDKIFFELELLRCECVELIFYNDVSNEFLRTLVAKLNKSIIRHVTLIVKEDGGKTIDFLSEICLSFNRISSVSVHSSKKEDIITMNNLTKIFFMKHCLTSFQNCGQISPNYFITNMLHFTESINHNSCLNKKISIDKDGNIKNCPSMKENFGNIKETTLEEALNHPNFKKYWNITKDQIDVCKDCEFRHICTDCRAYTENPDDQYSKPLKCGYDPYTNVWEEWSTNPLKQKAIEYYGMQELIKNDA